MANHTGQLLLNGVTEISDEAIKALSAHANQINLSGLTSLSDEAAEALGMHKGEGQLDLSGVTKLSEKAAESLAGHDDLMISDEIKELVNKYRPEEEEDNCWEGD